MSAHCAIVDQLWSARVVAWAALAIAGCTLGVLLAHMYVCVQDAPERATERSPMGDVEWRQAVAEGRTC